MQAYAIAKEATPIWNKNPWESYNPQNHAFIASNKNIPLEMIAFTGTLFKVEGLIGDDILEVSTAEYPLLHPSNKLYIDSALVTFTDTPSTSPKKVLPPPKEILETLFSYKGTRYLWGGNVKKGISSCEKYYKQRPLSSYGIFDIVNLERNLRLQGVDCSGLLYEATNGVTPRNTSQLIYFGFSLCIQGKTPEAIAEMVQPLDLIVWTGHVIIVFNQKETIESNGRDNFDGDENFNQVVMRNLVDRLTELMKTRSPVNCYSDEATIQQFPERFVINRWI